MGISRVRELQEWAERYALWQDEGMRAGDTPEVWTYLRAPEDSPLAPESARAIRDVLEAARDKFTYEPEWEVRATVVARLHAADEAEALQVLCDRLAHGVPDGYGIATVDAARVDL